MFLFSKAKSRPRPFYGWIIVAGTFFIKALGNGFGNQGFGAFLPAFEAQFGWSKTTLSGASSFMQLESGIMGPIEGTLSDRLGPRKMITIGTLIFGSGLIFLSFVNSVLLFYAAFIVIAIGSSFAGFTVTSVAINNWFRRRRTLAIAIGQMGSAFGGILVVPAIVWSIHEFGWRATTFGGGICVWTILLPIAMLMRTRPEDYGLLPDGDPPNGGCGRIDGEAQVPPTSSTDYTLGEAVRTRSFWLLGFGHGFSVIAISAVATHQFSHMEDERGVGLSAGVAAIVVTILSAANLSSSLIGGIMGDRVEKRYLAVLGNLGSAVALVIFAFADSFGEAVIFAIIFGFSWGIRGPIMTSIRGDYFGREHFGKIIGTSSMVIMPFAVLGPILAGFIADIQGEYHMALIIMAALTTIGAVMFLLARPPVKKQASLKA